MKGDARQICLDKLKRRRRFKECLISPTRSNRQTAGRVADPPFEMKCRLSETTYTRNSFRTERILFGTGLIPRRLRRSRIFQFSIFNLYHLRCRVELEMAQLGSASWILSVPVSEILVPSRRSVSSAVRAVRKGIEESETGVPLRFR